MRRVPVATLALLVVFTVAPALAEADFGLAPGYPKVSVLDTAGDPYTAAGGHPDRVRIEMAYERDDEGLVSGNAKETAVNMPPGFAGDPNAVPVCTRREFDPISGDCKPESQVGVVNIVVDGTSNLAPLYSVESAPNELAVVGTHLIGKSPFTMRLRPDDFGLTILQTDLPQLPFEKTEIELWGIPADHQVDTGIPRLPFVTLPARCDGGPLAMTVEMRSWQQPDRWVTASGNTGLALTDCGALSFKPSIAFDLGNPPLDSPSGATIGLDLPQTSDPNGRGSVATKAVSVALPAGLSISPGAAQGLSACADAALHRGSSQPATCPPSSRVGTVELSGPQLRQPLLGRLYLGAERPGERFRIFVVAEGMGVSAKFAGALEVDRATGRITTRLENLPELAFAHIGLRFDDGPGALLATPLSCGQLTATGIFTPHGGFPPAQSAATAGVQRGIGGQACPARPPFAPSFSGGSTNARAGAATGLTLTLRRQPGEQLPDRFSAELPRGISAAFDSVARCGDGAAATGACPASSRVGSAIAEVGSGPRPARLGGGVYLAGPFRGAPFSIAIAFGGAIGPFDLGTTVTRAALRVDRESGRVSIETESLPRSIEGIPVRFRTIGLDIDRPGFIRNPTSCQPATIDVSIRSVTAAVSRSSSPFAVRGCDSLRFQPQLSMRLTGQSELRPGGTPGLRIGIRARSRKATNMKAADIALPGYLRLNAASRREICARQDAVEGECPAVSKVGTASGRTPLLKERLAGPIHLVQPEGSGPPELWTSLDVMGISLAVHSRLSSREGRIHTKLVDLPDIAISQLALKLDGGKRGILALRGDPCGPNGRRARATVAFEGQNRAYRIERAPLEGCGRVGGG